MTKKSDLDQGTEERGSDSLKSDRDPDMKPAVATSSDNDADSKLQKEKFKNAGLSEEFFLSDLSGD